MTFENENSQSKAADFGLKRQAWMDSVGVWESFPKCIRRTVGFERLVEMFSITCKREDSSCWKTSVTVLMMLFVPSHHRACKFVN